MKLSELSLTALTAQRAQKVITASQFFGRLAIQPFFYVSWVDVNIAETSEI